MNHRTRDTLIGISLVLNVLLAAALLYDYVTGNGQFALAIVAAYFVFTLVFLFMWALTRREEVAQDVSAHADARPLPRAAVAVHPLPAQPVVQAKPTPPAPVPTPVPAPAAPVVVMEEVPFTYAGYTLYSRDVELKNGDRRPIWFFAKHHPKSGKPAAKPAGYHVGVNERTGLPFLKKGTGSDGEDLTPNVVAEYRPQCAALTEEGHQCRNSARHESKYCASHFGYQPPLMAKAAAAREDTLPRVKGARDTKPSVRKPSA